MPDVTSIPAVALHDGVEIPQLGFGVFQVPPAETQQVVEEALAAGYRHIDTAAAYRNEAGVGEAIAATGLARDEVFVTTKLWNSEQGYDSTLSAFEQSLERLGLEHVDLYLIHWPVPSEDRYLDTWRAFEKIHAEGRARSIGVSNFRVEDLERLEAEAERLPTVNQIDSIPVSSRPGCAPGTPSTTSPPRPGAHSPRAPCSTTTRSRRSPPTARRRRPR
jgi:diketogulonate reductase-like aldo/keto reductase